MKRLFGCALFCFAAFGLVLAQEPPKPKDKAEEKDSFESVLKEMLKTLNATTDLLAKATDDASAKDAKPKLEKLGAEMQSLQDRVGKLGKPSADEEKKLEEKYKNDLENVVKKLTSESLRLAQTSYGKDLLEALKPKAKKPDDKPMEKPPEKKPEGK